MILIEWFLDAVLWFFDAWVTVIIFGSFGMMIFCILCLLMIGSFLKNLSKNW